MANKILTLNNGIQAADIKEVYSDIDLTSIPVNKSQTYNNSKLMIQKDINVKAVQNSLHNIFTWQLGERILNPDFGSRLREYLYEGITDFNKEQIIAEVQNCVSIWEPRVKIVKIINKSNVNSDDENTVVLDIIYTIPELNTSQYNYTYEYQKVV